MTRNRPKREEDSEALGRLHDSLIAICDLMPRGAEAMPLVIGTPRTKEARKFVREYVALGIKERRYRRKKARTRESKIDKDGFYCLAWFDECFNPPKKGVERSPRAMYVTKDAEKVLIRLVRQRRVGVWYRNDDGSVVLAPDHMLLWLELERRGLIAWAGSGYPVSTSKGYHIAHWLYQWRYRHGQY